MNKVLITGAGGLIGSEAVSFFSNKGFKVLGIDNNYRQYFFGSGASVQWNIDRLLEKFTCYQHFNLDIRDRTNLEKLFLQNKFDLIIHTAAQPSHDWAAKEPHTDFEINALGTLNLLECLRTHCPEAVFIFTSTNKVYGDRPNSLPLTELESRYDLNQAHEFYKGVDESMNIDSTLHSLFGVSKLSADLMVQEYGRYFNLKTGVFRGGCLTGPAHSGAELHGFLSYLVQCFYSQNTYFINGYKGKQVRDNIHSHDLVNAFYHFFLNPICGEVFNIGGGRANSLSILEAIDKITQLSQREINLEELFEPRLGDHQWWISSNEKFAQQYPDWFLQYSVDEILISLNDAARKRC